MPTSNLDVASTIIKIVQEVNPNSILDFGIGFGKYGYLLREYLDVWRLSEGFSGNLADHFITKIDGIEVNPRYVSDIQRRIYNQIYIGDGSKIINTVGDYDVVLLLDVLEHFTKEGVLFCWKKFIKKYRKH